MHARGQELRARAPAPPHALAKHLCGTGRDGHRERDKAPTREQFGTRNTLTRRTHTNNHDTYNAMYSVEMKIERGTRAAVPSLGTHRIAFTSTRFGSESAAKFRGNDSSLERTPRYNILGNPLSKRSAFPTRRPQHHTPRYGSAGASPATLVNTSDTAETIIFCHGKPVMCMGVSCPRGYCGRGCIMPGGHGTGGPFMKFQTQAVRSQAAVAIRFSSKRLRSMPSTNSLWWV